MTEKAKKYLADCAQAIALIEEFSAGISDYEHYETDLKTKSAIERQLGIIGEAVNKFEKEEQQYKLSNSRKIISFRNWLIHAYSNIDDAIVWTILQNYLPLLKEEIAVGLNKTEEN